jgi:hypothetical protein
MKARTVIAFLTDNNVPNSVVQTLKRRGHDVVTVREAIAADASDPEVAETAIRSNRVLVSWDRDFNHQRFQKPRFAALHRIAFCCPEPDGAQRLKKLMERIEFEYAQADASHPLLIRIAKDKIQIRC